MEMWEAARRRSRSCLLPAVGGGFDLADAKHLLSNLEVEMEMRNQYCMPEVAHLRKQGVTDVRELEDVLLAHIGVSDDLERPGRPVPPERSKQQGSYQGRQRDKEAAGGGAARPGRQLRKGRGASAVSAQAAGSTLRRRGSSLAATRDVLEQPAERPRGKSLRPFVAKAGPSSPSSPAAGAEDRSSLVTIGAAATGAGGPNFPGARQLTGASGRHRGPSSVRVKFRGEAGAAVRRHDHPRRRRRRRKTSRRARPGGRGSWAGRTMRRSVGSQMHDGAVGLAHGVGNAARRAHEAAAHAAHEAT